MSTKKRILFIATEMSPYLELTEFADIVNKLAIKSNDSGLEVRCIMPRFGVINERRHRLHEVVRLSGINVSVDDDDYPLQIKVASLPNARLQVYFLDNEDFFKRKDQIFHDENETWFDDNDLRTVFFCKGALETVKKFGWSPDVVHCSGWMTGLIPMYIKTVYKREPVFAHSKVVFTIGSQTFSENLGDSFLKKAQIAPTITQKELDIYKAADNTAMYRGGAHFADAVTFGTDEVEPSLAADFAKVRGKRILPFRSWEADLTDYLDLYNEIASK
ncbi:MAG: starch synthase [Bacteroidetes bacterium]|jgi:starch synthase|nr:MAG: starch synthase [Bacteroidota bacterium]TAE63419.1 MAG: starch synthase [Bacteroidota bacterium]TAF97748.1 MAG: starch synthase [Bacteroidota bacterium]